MPLIVPAGRRARRTDPVPAAQMDLRDRCEAYCGQCTPVDEREITMWRLIGILLAVWLVITVIGVVIKAVFWLAIVGAVLFVATAALGWNKRRSDVAGGRRALR
jgi:hypothetical protein